MSKRNKLMKFAELLSFPNVFENFDAKSPSLAGKDGVQVELKGKWREKYFKNNNPLVLELACGKGDYTLGLARLTPEKNYIGVDIKGARIWKGAGIALGEGLENVAFLRTRIEQLSHFFEENEVSEIWITFPDPFLRESKSTRRLTAPNFLNIYSKVLQKGGVIHLKTDSPELYQFTQETLTAQSDYELLYEDDDIYAKPLPWPELDIKTFYERMHLAAGKTIKYIRIRLKN